MILQGKREAPDQLRNSPSLEALCPGAAYVFPAKIGGLARTLAFGTSPGYVPSHAGQLFASTELNCLAVFSRTLGGDCWEFTHVGVIEPVGCPTLDRLRAASQLYAEPLGGRSVLP